MCSIKYPHYDKTRRTEVYYITGVDDRVRYSEPDVMDICLNQA